MKKKQMNKKGLALNDLYGIVIVLVLIGVVLGLGLTILNKMVTSCAVDTNLNGTCTTTENLTAGASETAINSTVTAIADIPTTWLGIIVLVVVAVIVIVLVVKNLGMAGSSR